MLKGFRFIMGRNCIMEMMRHAPHRLVEVYTADKLDKGSLYADLLDQGIKVVEKSKQQLSRMVDSESHQLYVAAIKERSLPTIKEFLNNVEDQEHSLVLMLDSIYDPQNFGAILRAAECFGVDLVIYSKNRGADITPTVTKTSAGATELVPLCRVSNLVETLLAFQKEGFVAIAAEISPKSQDLYTLKIPSKCLIILGSEGEGIQPLLSKKSDIHAIVPMLGKIDSLNVSQAAAVFLSCYRRSF